MMGNPEPRFLAAACWATLRVLNGRDDFPAARRGLGAVPHHERTETFLVLLARAVEELAAATHLDPYALLHQWGIDYENERTDR